MLLTMLLIVYMYSLSVCSDGVFRYSWDVTAATWGGSTAHTMESEVMSMYSTEDFDTTKEMGSQQEEEGDDTLLPERFASDHYPYQVQDCHFSNTRSGPPGAVQYSQTSII